MQSIEDAKQELAECRDPATPALPTPSPSFQECHALYTYLVAGDRSRLQYTVDTSYYVLVDT